MSKPSTRAFQIHAQSHTIVYVHTEIKYHVTAPGKH